jgi:hypothetical protein
MNSPFRTEAQKQLNFTKEEGIAIQTQQLKEFRSVMSAEAFDVLQKLVTADNDKAVDGFDIVRGGDIDRILHHEVILFFSERKN